MKKIVLLALGSLLVTGVSFAEDMPKNEQKDTETNKQSLYKSSTTIELS